MHSFWRVQSKNFSDAGSTEVPEEAEGNPSPRVKRKRTGDRVDQGVIHGWNGPKKRVSGTTLRSQWWKLR